MIVMWERIKMRVKVWGATAMVVLVICAGRIDNFVIATYEKFVGDPLQTRGISLALQTRGLYTAGAFYMLFSPPLSMWNLVGFVLWLSNAVYLRLGFLEPPPSDVTQRNVTRVIFPFIAMRCSIYFFGLTTAIVHMYIGLFLVLIVVVSACDPKPPRPKRLRILVPASEGI